MRIWSRATAVPVNAIVPTTAAAAQAMNFLLTLISFWR